MSNCLKLAVSLVVVLVGLICLASIFPDFIWPCFDCKNTQEEIIFWQLRLPRVILAFVVGALLAVAGVVFQALFRNPLASPYTMGVSSGAALGAALYINLAGTAAMLGSSSVTIFALIGALSTSALVVFLIIKAQLNSETSILLGVIINLFFGSIILLLQYISDQAELLQITRWLMGSISVVGWSELVVLSIVTLVGMPILYLWGVKLDLISFGDEVALAHGINIKSSYSSCILLVSIIVAVVVSITGPIGFIGIVVPHYLRMFGIRTNRPLLLAAFLSGGLFLAICDSIARSILFPFEVPVGVVTALLGSPLFFVILLKRHSNST